MKQHDLLRLQRTHIHQNHGNDARCKPFFAVMNAADKAKAEFEAKREKLLQDGRLTAAGIAEQLAADVNAFRAKAADLRDAVINPAAAKLTSAPSVPDATDADRELVAAFRQLPGAERSAHLAAALVGRDSQLANALIRCHPMTTGLTADTVNQLKSRVGLAVASDSPPLRAAALADQLLSQTLSDMQESIQ